MKQHSPGMILKRTRQRDGRNITPDEFNKAMISALNYSPDLANTITTSMLEKLGNPAAVNLEALNNFTAQTDHDASFSRLDNIQSKELTPEGTPIGTLVPNAGLIDQLLSDTSPKEFPFLNTTSFARTRLRREAESVAAGSTPLTDGLNAGSITEAALAIQFIGEGGDANEIGGGEEVWDQRAACKHRMQEWLVFERFPKGWRRTRHPVSGEGDIGPLSNRIMLLKSQLA